MAPVPGVRGLRHVALRVRDIGRSKDFYRECFGMEIVWEPDPENVYLSSGNDNLALHAEARDGAPADNQQLDHLGFVVENAERVQALEKEFRGRGVKIIQPFKVHRDGSASFYLADPDGIVIQMLYEPHISPQEFK
jgi:catechol 2,3-dioxygenase-like lactoylglutathione lyase family enzyme